MIDEGQHEASVDAWLVRSTKGLPPAALMQLFASALGGLWARTATTLGEVTLTAIADRVLHNASEKLPLFSSLRIGPDGEIQFRELLETGSSMRAADLVGGIRFVLVEFLTVVGNLTAEILTAELHAELARAEPTNAVRGPKGPPGNPANVGGIEGEGKG